MNPEDEISSAFRKGGGRLVLKNVVVRASGTRHKGDGILTIASPRFLLDITISEFGPFDSDDRPRIIHRKDFWDVRGTAEDIVAFRCPKVPPAHISKGSPPGTRLSGKVDCFDVIHQLVPDEFRGKWMRVHGVLPNYELTFADELTTTSRENAFWGKVTSSKVDFFRSETKYFKFGFQQCDSDTQVFFESKSDWRKCSPFDVMRQWRSLLKALSFVTGIEARPFIEVFSPGDKWLERYRPIRPNPTTNYTPFGTLSFVNKHETSAIALMAEFLCDSPIADKISSTTNLTRAVGGKSLRLATLVHAVLFEGLVDVLYEQIAPPPRSEEERKADEAFERVRTAEQNEITNKMKTAEEPEATAYRRLLGLLTTAKALRTKEKFERLAAHYKLRGLEECLDAWGKARNPVAHGALWSVDSPEVIEGDWRNGSLIASAINVLILKSIGYTGRCTKWNPLPETISI